MQEPLATFNIKHVLAIHSDLDIQIDANYDIFLSSKQWLREVPFWTCFVTKVTAMRTWGKLFFPSRFCMQSM